MPSSSIAGEHSEPVMERIDQLQAAEGASALSVKTKFPLGQDAPRSAGLDQGTIIANLVSLRRPLIRPLRGHLLPEGRRGKRWLS
jgi:hypothetical protein